MEKFNALHKLTNKGFGKEITSQDYIEYVLKNGSPLEKGQVLRCVKGQLVLKEGEVGLKSKKSK